MGSLIYLFLYKSGFMFFVTKTGKVSSNPGKAHFEGLLQLFRYIRENKKLGFKYYAKIEDAPLSELLRQSRKKLRTN